MGKYKLNPLEELRLEKRRHKEERAIASQRLSYELQYLSDNWGSMLTKEITTSLKSRFTEAFHSLSAPSTTSVTPFTTKRHSSWLNNTAMQIIMSNLPFMRSVAWRFAKPALITYSAKKISSLVFGRKRRRK